MTTDENTTEIEIPKPLGNILHVQFPDNGRKPKSKVSLSSRTPPVKRRESLLERLDGHLPPWVIRMVAVLGILGLSLLIL